MSAEYTLLVRPPTHTEVFVRRKRYQLPVYQSRHPGLTEYIGTLCRAIVAELQQVRRRTYQSSLQSVVVALHYEDALDASEACERYVFDLDMVLPEVDVRNRDLLYVPSLTRIRGNLSLATAELAARQFLLQLLAVDARVASLGERRTCPD